MASRTEIGELKDSPYHTPPDSGQLALTLAIVGAHVGKRWTPQSARENFRNSWLVGHL
jgi:hypothetical protein